MGLDSVVSILALGGKLSWWVTLGLWYGHERKLLRHDGRLLRLEARAWPRGVRV